MKTKMLIESFATAKSKQKSDIDDAAKIVYYNILKTCKDLGAEVEYTNMGGLHSDGINVDATIHVYVEREDSPTFKKLMLDQHKTIKKIQYI